MTILEGQLTRGSGRPLRARWSPTSTHLVYERLRIPRKLGQPGTLDVYRAAADGTDEKNLTRDTDAGATPVGWR